MTCMDCKYRREKSDKQLYTILILLAFLILLAAGCSFQQTISNLRLATVTLPVLVMQQITVTPTGQPQPSNAPNISTTLIGPTPTPTRHTTPTNTPVSLPVPTEASIQNLPYSQCDQISILEDVTIPDGTVLQPGEVFVKSWRVENTGTCTWTDGYYLVLTQGDDLNAPRWATANFLRTDDRIDTGIGTWGVRVHRVLTHDQVDIAMVFQAPQSPGTYAGYWALVNAKNERIEPSFWVSITVEEQASAIKNSWAGDWVIRDPFSSDEQYTLAHLYQQDNRIIGFFHNIRRDVSMLNGYLSQDGLTFKGEYGEPWQQFSSGIELKMGDGWKKFQGISRSRLSGVGSICGARAGYPMPEPCVAVPKME